MKTALLLFLLFLVNSGSAETSVPYTPDSLKKSDWMEIESVHYYPYVAPGIEEKVPWRAENIRRVIFKATVTDLNERTLTLDYTFKSLYDCRNDTGKPGFYYFDSRYQQDFVRSRDDRQTVPARHIRSEKPESTYFRQARNNLFLLEKLCSFRSKTGRVVRLSGNDRPRFLTLGQTACTSGTKSPDRLAGRRDAPVDTKHTGHRRFILPSSEYGVYV